MTYTAVAFHDQLRKSPGLSDAAVRVALILSGYADAEGQCWPSQRKLAAQLEWSLRKVERSIDELKTVGLVVYLVRARHRGEHSIIQLRTTVTHDTADIPVGGLQEGTTDKIDREPPSDSTRTTVTDGGRNSPRNSPIELPQARARELTPEEFAAQAQCAREAKKKILSLAGKSVNGEF